MAYNWLGRRPTFTGGLNKTVINAASTGTPMRAGKLYTIRSTVSSTGTGIKNYTLAAPLASEVGLAVIIHCIQATTIKAPRVTLTAASLYSTVSSTATTKDTIRFGRADQAVVLRAFSTSKWKAEVLTNSPTITTS